MRERERDLEICTSEEIFADQGDLKAKAARIKTGFCFCVCACVFYP